MTPNSPTAAAPRLGPLLHATLIVGQAAPFLAAYAQLGLHAQPRGRIAGTQAQAWGQPQLAGCMLFELALSPTATPVLRVIERSGAAARPTRFSHGWMALEILVRDVDALAAKLPLPGFAMVGPPADLDVSPHIRAMQLVGPAGEMLYLTQVKAPVPPFDIPLSAQLPATQMWGPLFIAVMSTASRAAVLRSCAQLGSGATWQFDTKVSVLNRALGQTLERRWPVATVQWAGSSLFEVDEVQHPKVSSARSGELPDGLAWVSLAIADGLETNSGPALQELSPGVWVELLPASAQGLN